MKAVDSVNVEQLLTKSCSTGIPEHSLKVLVDQFKIDVVLHSEGIGRGQTTDSGWTKHFLSN